MNEDGDLCDGGGADAWGDGGAGEGRPVAMALWSERFTLRRRQGCGDLLAVEAVGMMGALVVGWEVADELGLCSQMG